MMVRLLHSQKREIPYTHTHAHTQNSSDRHEPVRLYVCPSRAKGTPHPTHHHHPLFFPRLSGTTRFRPFPPGPPRGKKKDGCAHPGRAGGQAGGGGRAGWWESAREQQHDCTSLSPRRQGETKEGEWPLPPLRTVHRRGRKGESTTRSTRLWGEGAIYSVRGETVVINSGGVRCPPLP